MSNDAWNQINAATADPTPEELKAIQEQTTAAQDRQAQANADAAGLFGSEQGQRFLAFLEAETVNQTTLPSAIFQGLDGIAVSILQNIREGENNLVRRIQSMIKKGKETHVTG